MKVIGIDLDGTIFVLLSKPKKAVVEKMQAMEKQGCQFVIVTRRPRQRFCFWLTKKLLIFHGVPFKSLFCVGISRGAEERKLQIIKEIKIEVFIDSNKRIVEFMKRNSVHVADSLEYFDDS